MTRIRAIAVAIGLSIGSGSVPALAGQQVYTYTIIHPFYGDIGTFTDTINRSREAMRIDSRLRVAVTLLGIVVYRQASDITEIMQGSRLVSLQSATDKDGTHVEVNGKAQGDKFLVNATAGAFAGPASIAPSDPWVLKGIGKGTVVFTDTGRIIDVDISGDDYEMISVNGASVSARHFVVMGDKRQDVWVDGQEMPIMFRVTEKGSPIDFVLQNATVEADAGDVMEVVQTKLPMARPSNGGK